MATAEVRRYWTRVAALGCCIDKGEATIHHVHGGSCAGLSGMGLKSNDWLVIPLCTDHHTGKNGIDTGQGTFRSVTAWEEANGAQLAFLVQVAMTLKVDIFARANVDLLRLWSYGFSTVASPLPKVFPRSR